jgi:hypothetical protein
LTVTDDDGAVDVDTVEVTIADEPAELLRNPSFESWTTSGRLRPEYWLIDWNRSTTALAESADAIDGGRAADITTSHLYNGIHQEILLSDTALQVGDQIAVGAWLKGVEGVAAARVAVKYYASGGGLIGFGSYDVLGLSGDWGYAEATGTIPSGTAAIQIQVHPTAWVSGASSGTFRADAISLTHS